MPVGLGEGRKSQLLQQVHNCKSDQSHLVGLSASQAEQASFVKNKEVYSYMASLEPKLRERVLTNTLLDSHALNSGKEGASQLVMLNLFKNFFPEGSKEREFFSKATKRSLIGCSFNSASLLDKASDIRVEIEELAIGSPLLIPGGWTSEPFGHSMYYLLVKKPDNLFDFYILNTGDGLDNHPSAKFLGKDKKLVVLPFKNVPKDEILYPSVGIKDFGIYQSFNGFLEELLSFTGEAQSSEFRASNIYNGSFAHLAKYVDYENELNFELLFAKPQRSGTCSFQSLKAVYRLFLFLNGKGIDDYRRFILEAKFQVLIAYMELQGEEYSCALEEAKKQFAYTLSKPYIPEDYSLFFYEEVLSKINLPSLHPLELLKPKKEANFKGNLISDRFAGESYELALPKTLKLFSFDIFVGLEPGSGSYLRKIIDNLPSLEDLREKTSPEHDYLCKELERWAYAVDLDLSVPVSDVTIYEIDRIYECYSKYLLSLNKFTPRQLNTLLVLYYISWAATLDKIKEQIPKGAISFFDRENKAKLQEALKLFDNLGLSKDLFAIHELNFFTYFTSSSDQKRYIDIKTAFEDISKDKKFSLSPVCREIVTFNINQSAQYGKPDFYWELAQLSKDELKEKASEELKISGPMALTIIISTSDFQLEVEGLDPLVNLRRKLNTLRQILDLERNPRRNETSASLYDYKKVTGKFDLYPGYHGEYTVRYKEKGSNSRGSLRLIAGNSAHLLCENLSYYRKWETHVIDYHSKERALPNVLVTLNKQSAYFGSELPDSLQFKSSTNLENISISELSVVGEFAEEDRTLIASISTPDISASRLLTFFTQHSQSLFLPQNRSFLVSQLFKMTFPEGKNRVQVELERDPVHFLQEVLRLVEITNNLALNTEVSSSHELLIFNAHILTAIKCYIDSPKGKMTGNLEQALSEQLNLINQQLEVLHSEDNGNSLEITRLYAQEKLQLLFCQTPVDFKVSFEDFFIPYFIIGSINPEKTTVFSCSHNDDYQEPVKNFVEFFHDKIKEDNIGEDALQAIIRAIVSATNCTDITGYDYPINDLSIVDGIVSFYFDKQGRENIKLNLNTGHIYYNNSLFQQSSSTDSMLLSAKLTKILDNETYHIKRIGSKMFIRHSSGIFKVIVNTKGQEQVLFKPREAKEWLIYRPADELRFPMAFIKDYIHFYSREHGLYFFVKNRRYEDILNAMTCNIHTGVFQHADETFSIYRCTHTALNAFAGIEHHYEASFNNRRQKTPFVKTDSKSGKTTLHLWEYQLSFLSDPKLGLVWEENPNFFISDKRVPVENLSFSSRVLVLENVKGELKILVPYMELKEADGFSPILSAYDTPANSVFFTFDITEAPFTLSAPTLNGKLYLAYIYLKQRDYKNFHLLIQSISPASKFDSESLSIFIKFIDSSSYGANNTPESCACLLRAACLIKRMDLNKEPFDKKNSFSNPLNISRKKLLIAYVCQYQNTEHLINIDHRLSGKEKAFLSSLLIEIDRWKKLNEKDEFIHFRDPDSKLEKVLRSETPSGSINFGELSYQAVESDFFSIYEYILGNNNLLPILNQSLQNLFNSSRVSRKEVDKVILKCIIAKQNGALLPKLSEEFRRKLALAYDDLRSKKTDHANEFFKSLFKNVLNQPYCYLKGFTKRANLPDSSKISSTASPETPIYPIDESLAVIAKSSKGQAPLFEQLAFCASKKRSSSLPELTFPTTKSDSPAMISAAKALSQDIAYGRSRLLDYESQREEGLSWVKTKGFQGIIKKELEASSTRLKGCESTILEKICSHLRVADVKGTFTLTTKQLRTLHGGLSKLEIRNLEYIALWGSKESEYFERACERCPMLRDKGFQEAIFYMLQDYLEEYIKCQSLKKLLKKSEELSASNKAQSSILYSEISAILSTDLSKLSQIGQLNYLQLLIFIKSSGIIPRLDQIDDIVAISSDTPCILQKIMGGGKTSVIAAIWAFIIARYRSDEMPAIFVDSPLYLSFIGNVKDSQYTALKQHIFTVDYSLEELKSKDKLDKLLVELREGLAERKLLVMKAERLQSYELQFQRLSLEKDNEGGKFHELWEGFGKVLNFFREKCVVLGDEIDLLFRSNFRVNIPLGEKVGLLASRIDLVRQISLLLSENENLGLLEERQALKSPEELEQIYRQIAKKIAFHPSLDIPQELVEDFCLFLSQPKNNPIPPRIVEYTKLLRQSKNEKMLEKCELIALTRHILQDLLPDVFSQLPGVHFGRKEDKEYPGKVVPFLGVDMPSSREFGYHNEALYKHFFTAIMKGVEEVQVENFVKVFMDDAQREVSLKACHFSSTQAAGNFEKVTGCTLHNNKTKSKTLLMEKCKSDIRTRLYIEAETAKQCILYNRYFLCSTAQDLPKLVKSMRGMTGTPWNFDGYEKSTRQLREDKGAEGQVIYQLLRRPCSIFSLVSTRPTMQDLFDKYLVSYARLPEVVLDMGALFKYQSIALTAQDYLKTYNKSVSSKEKKKAILYYDGDNLVVGKLVKASWVEQALPNTREDSINAKGLFRGDYLVFFDQRHTTGSDIPLAIDAHAIVTTSESLELRTLLQTVMRLRMFCQLQTADFVMSEALHSHISSKHGEMSIPAILRQALLNQLEKKKKSNMQALGQMIDGIMVHSFQSISTDISRKFDLKIFSKLLLQEVADSPFIQFFKSLRLVSPIEPLKAYAAQCLEEANVIARELQPYRQLIPAIEAEVQGVIEYAEKLLRENKLEGLVYERNAEESELGNENEIDLDATVEKEQDTEEQIDQELEQENVSYDAMRCFDKYIPDQWWDNKDPELSIRDFIKAVMVKDQRHRSSLKTAPEIFSLVKYMRGRKFEDIFPGNILMTASMQRSHSSYLPIFSKAQKMCESVLVVCTDPALPSYNFVIVSSYEAAFIQKFLPTSALYKEGKAFLLKSNGQSMIGELDGYAKKMSELERERIYENLVMCNLYIGRASPIEEIPEGLTYLQMWLENNSLGTEKDRTDYLELRDKHLSPVDRFSRFKIYEGASSVCAQMMQKELSPEQVQRLTNRKAIFSLSRSEVIHTTPEQIPYVRGSYLKLFKDKERINATPPDKYSSLNSKQIALITGEERVSRISERQVKYVAEAEVKHLSDTQVKCISSNQVAHIRDEQIKLLPSWLVEYVSLAKVGLLNDSQLAHLSLMQVQALPGGRVKDLPEEKLHMLSEDQIENVPLTKVKSLEGWQLAHLNKEQVRVLTKAQVKALPKEKLHMLSPRQIESQFVPIAMVQHLHETQLTYLNEEQVKALADRQVALLPKEKLHMLSAEQIKHVAITQVKSLDRWQLAYLNEEQVQALTDRQVKLLPGEKLHMLSAEQIKHVSSAMIQYLHVQQLAHLNELQVQALTGKQIKLLPGEKLHMLSPEQVKHVPLVAVQYLHDTQLAYLNEEQVQVLTNQQVKVLPKEKLHLLSPVQVQSVDISILEYLHDSQVAYLSQEQGEALKQQLAFFNEKQVQGLGKLRVRMLPKEKLHMLSEGQIKHVPVDMVQYLHDTQLAYLNEEQVQALTERQVKLLPKEKLHMLSPEQVQFVRIDMLQYLNQQQLAHLNQKQVQALTNRQVELLPEERLHMLSANQVEFVATAMLKHLHNSQLAHLNQKQLRALTERQIKVLPREKLHMLSADQIPFVSVDMVQHLHDSQVSFLNKREQINNLSSRQINLLPTDKIGKISNAFFGVLDKEKFACIPIHRVIKECSFKHFLKMSFYQKVPFILSRALGVLLLYKTLSLSKSFLVRRY